jgi:Holliday junction DNA helicase RuvA
LVMPIREIATAIETKDAARLNRLPGVGARLAEKIIAELHGKTAKFALSRKDEPLAKPDSPVSPFADEATEVLLQLQYKANEAQLMIEKALTDNPKIKSAEELISTIFKSQHLAEAGG